MSDTIHYLWYAYSIFTFVLGVFIGVLVGMRMAKMERP